MNEWLKKFWEQVSGLWGKWTLVQKAIFSGLPVVFIAGVIALFAVSAAPTMVPVFDTSVADENLRLRNLGDGIELFAFLMTRLDAAWR